MAEKSNIIPWLLPAAIALATPFIYDFYVNKKDKQEVLWAHDYNSLEKSDVCSSVDSGSIKYYLYNKSKKLADVTIVSPKDIVELGMSPEHSTKIEKDDNGVTRVEIKGLKSRETVQLVLCGERYFGPNIETLNTDNESYESSSFKVTIRDRKEERFRFNFIFFGLLLIGLIAFLASLVLKTISEKEENMDSKNDS